MGVVPPITGDRFGRRRIGIFGNMQRIGQHALDQVGNAPSDIGTDRFQGQRRTPQIVQHGARGGMQIGQGIDQSAIKIEQDSADRLREHRFSGHHAPPASALRKSAITES